METLRIYRSRLRGSMWLVPGLLTLAGVLLALGLLRLDATLGPWLQEHFPWLLQPGQQGALAVLTTIAGSTITVAGVLFSITIVVFSLAASQYTSQVLGNFMADRTNQTVLGVFVAIFIYCLIVMQTLAGDPAQQIPGLSFLVAMVLALVGVAYLIYFIHHIAENIQASQVIKSVATETLEVIDEIFPEQPSAPAKVPNPPVEHWHPVSAERTGYIQHVAYQGLLELACRHHWIVRMEQAVGGFVFESLPLLSVADREPDRKATAALRACYTIRHDRSPSQDLGYGIRRLVDIAMKALSPAMNVTTTGIMCVDYLTAILAELCARPVHPPHQFEEGMIRLIARGPSFNELLDQAFNQIRESAANNSAILSRQLSSLEILLARTSDSGRRSALKAQIDATAEAIGNTISDTEVQSRLLEKARRIAANAT